MTYESAHQGCAFYATRLQLKEPRLELVQRADLVRAAAFVHRVTGLDAIEAHFARLTDGRVTFEPSAGLSALRRHRRPLDRADETLEHPPEHDSVKWKHRVPVRDAQQTTRAEPGGHHQLRACASG